MHYQNGGIVVDDDFVRFGSKSYAINKINTVDVRARKVRGKGLAYGIGAIGLLLLIGGFGEKGSSGMIVFGVVMLGLAALLYRRPDVYEYSLFLMTSSSEAQAFKTNDVDEVTNLRAAIEAAMMTRR